MGYFSGPKGRRRVFDVAFFTGILILAGWRLYHRYAPPPPNLVNWVHYNVVEQEAKAKQRPALIDFSADWCTPCRQMQREVFSKRDGADYINSHFVAAQVVSPDDDRPPLPPDGEKMLQRFGVENFPTLVIIPVDGKPIYHRGYGGKEKLLAFLRTHGGN